MPDPSDVKRSLYSRADINLLVQQRDRGRKPASIAASTISWGEPVIASGISTVREGRLIYRDLDAVVLAEDITLEQLAGHLWGYSGISFVNSRDAAVKIPAIVRLANSAANSPASLERSATDLIDDSSIAIADIAAGYDAFDQRKPMHDRLAHAFGQSTVKAIDGIRRALVLAADHELNASTYATRIAASTGASIAACLLAGLTTLSGPRHGGAQAHLDALMKIVGDRGAREAVRIWVESGYQVPGFGHPLYPNGDPRAVSMLDQLSLPADFDRLRDEVERELNLLPSFDFALAAFGRVHALSVGQMNGIFAVGRAVGWVAHVLEQIAEGKLIRPRARYVSVVQSDVGPADGLRGPKVTTKSDPMHRQRRQRPTHMNNGGGQ